METQRDASSDRGVAFRYDAHSSRERQRAVANGATTTRSRSWLVELTPVRRLLATILIGTIAAGLAAEPRFIEITPSPGPAETISAFDLSRDGIALVGSQRAVGLGWAHPFIWTEAHGTRSLVAPSDPGRWSAVAVSGGGRKVLGVRIDGFDTGFFRWTPEEGLVLLDRFPEYMHGGGQVRARCLVTSRVRARCTSTSDTHCHTASAECPGRRC